MSLFWGFDIFSEAAREMLVIGGLNLIFWGRSLPEGLETSVQLIPI